MKIQSTRHLLILSLLTGLLLTLSWCPNGFPGFLFIAFIPLLFVENYFYQNREKYHRYKFFKFAYVSFLTWNALTTYWIYHASFFGAVMAIVFNSLFMTVVFTLYHITKRQVSEKLGYISLICYWLTFEYLHLDWDLTWSWLNLGNGFAAYPSWYQWYEYTGTFGGTLWILLLNVLGFYILKNKIYNQISFLVQKKKIIAWFAMLIFPLVASICMYYNYEEKNNPVDITVLQPNIDPWNEKFDGMTVQEQLDKMLRLAAMKIDSNSQYLVGPETALPEELWENELLNSDNMDSLLKFMQPYPKLAVVIGLSTRRMFEKNEKLSETARKMGNTGMHYDYYNTAMQINREGKYALYHKSKLVPGVEKMPFPKILKPLEKLAIDLGGSTGSMGTQKTRDVFYHHQTNTGIAPVICYESIYGEYITDYIKNGANLIFIITNDGWWEDTPGYKQHYHYAKLRAVETRRSIARSANTGWSCFINQRGDALQTTQWWKPDVIRAKINANDKITFYVQYGDYIGRLAVYLCLLIIVYSLVFPYIIKKLNR